jgi:hypothetical protein
MRPEAATTPEMAPLAPSEVTKRRFCRTWTESEAKEPSRPAAMYRARKSPRPISSWTVVGFVSWLLGWGFR